MSCFILNTKSTAALAAMLDRVTGAARYSGTTRYGIYCGRDLHCLLSQEWEQMTGLRCVELDSQKIYAVLRRMNQQAYGERYGVGSEAQPEEMPLGEWVNTVYDNPWQMLKTFECYLYQCSEGDIDETELYKLLTVAKNQYMRHLIGKLPEYSEANWG